MAADRPLRIAMLMYQGNMYSGGQGIYLHYLSRELANMGHDVHVLAGPPLPTLDPRVTLHPIDSWSTWTLMDDKEGYIRRMQKQPFGLFYPLNFLEYLTTRGSVFSLIIAYSVRAFIKLRQLHMEKPFDLIHDNQSMGFGSLAMKALGLPMVVTIHHPLPVDRVNSIIQSRNPYERVRRVMFYPVGMQELVSKRMDAMITVSKASAQKIEETFGIRQADMHIVYNGIDTEVFRPLPEIEAEPRAIVWVGNSEDRNKGVKYLLEAAGILRDQGVDFRLVLKDRDRRHLKYAPSIINRLHLGTRTTFLTRMPSSELARLYNRAEIVVSPSVFEGFGLPAAEAMSCGRPVIATTGGAFPEVIEHGVSGLLVPPADPVALAAAIKGLLDDPAERERLGRAGRERILSAFNWPKAARETVQVYRKVLGQACHKPMAPLQSSP
ncbi:MAG: glycosyltransferase family 4 protein [Dehalococcoidia bacterium]